MKKPLAAVVERPKEKSLYDESDIEAFFALGEIDWEKFLMLREEGNFVLERMVVNKLLQTGVITNPRENSIYFPQTRGDNLNVKCGGGPIPKTYDFLRESDARNYLKAKAKYAPSIKSVEIARRVSVWSSSSSG